ncbi:MAG: N-acetylmuramoyl-L-alanine amidase [Nitrospira sp.]|nr:N-acetylmuramoyl-L-alanine amidase [Nitrospira sp.]MBH0196924.1 N-acetylmuramoyl-L-alanine amidase [Nitrospira sp.]
MPRRPRQRILSIALTALILCGFFSALIPAIWAAPLADQEQRSRTSKSSKPSKLNATTASLAPVVVHDFRILTSPEKTRLVLDLDRYAKAIERRAKSPGRVILILPNTSLSHAAQLKASNGTLPSPFTVTQATSHTVALSLQTDSLQTYKQYTLVNPPRLVVDITRPSEQNPLSSIEAQRPVPSSSFPSVQPAAPPTKGYTTIVIDPGHGGKDSGAVGLRQTEEKDITLKVGLQLKELLSKQPGVRVLMTRDRDVFIELEERAKYANSHDADLFVSVHVNSHPSRSVKGIEIYHFGEAKDQRALEVAARENGTPLSSTGIGWEYLVADLLTTKKIEASLELAWTAKEAMITHMNGQYAINDHGVKTAPFYVLRFTSMPSILAEIAYISNPNEEDLLRKPAFVRDVAQSLFKGISAFLANNRM